MHAVHAARKEIARKIAACRKKPLGKLLRAASGSTRRPGVSLTRIERDGQEDGGVQERDAADFEDGGVERGQGVVRLVQEGRKRHAADLEDVVDGDEDENVIVARRRRFTFQGDLP